MALQHKVLSLFSSAGIGELGIEASGMEIVVSNEIDKTRNLLYKENFPNVEAICGDIWAEKEHIISEWRKKESVPPFLIYATPPCQGMSSNGAGKLLREIRDGRRTKEDPRNRLIIPTVEIIKALRPEWVLLENVPNMDQTIIRDENDNYVNIIEYIKQQLSDEYIGQAEVVNCADYGIPQTRKRLITIFTRNEHGKKYFEEKGTFLPPSTHSETGEKDKLPWVTLKSAIGHFPALCADIGKNQRIDFNKFHIVPIIDKEKLWWIDNTEEGNTAYNNQCCNPKCLYRDNPSHGSNYEDGIHQSNKDTPIYCMKCGSLLPRPTVIDKKTGKRRLIKGFDTAYRRMEWDKPAPTLTQKMHAVASDKKIHPSQNRALSLYEAMVIQSINEYDYNFSIAGKEVSRNTICQIIGESVPPKIIEIICQHILKMYGEPSN